MKKINFEDLPSTDTPINSANLNQLQTNIEDALFYKDGDIYTQKAGGYYIGGTLTGGAKTIGFSFAVPKSLKKIKSITVNNWGLTIRKTSGGYHLNEAKMVDFDGTSTATIISDNVIRFVINQNTAFQDTNNTPVGVCIDSINLTFNE